MLDSNKIFWIILILVVGYLVDILSPILTPFVMGAILAYVGDPLVDKLEKHRFTRTLAVTTVFVGLSLIMTILLLILIPMIERQIGTLVEKVPVYMNVIQTEFIPWLQQRFNVDVSIDEKTVITALNDYWQDAGGIVSNIIGYITSSSLVLLGWFANLMLIPVVTFYLLRDWDGFVGRIRELLPRQNEPVISDLARQSDVVLGSFLRGQMMIMFLLGCIYSIGLWIVGIDLALLIGMIAGLVSFVPYLGFIVGILAASIAALIQFQEAMPLVYVLIVFGIGQTIEGFLLTPLLIGNKIGLHPVAVIFAVMAGGQLFGFIGILLALPAAAVIAVVLRYWHQQYKNSRLYSGST